MRRTIIAATLIAVACLGAASTAQAQAVLTLEGDCPGRMALRWDGATPDRWMALLYADTTGNYTIPNVWCAGTQTGLGTRNLRLVSLLRSGPQGSGTHSGRASAQFCGGYLQMIVYGFPCSTSNVVQIPQ